MVRVIYITKNKDFQIPPPKIILFEEYLQRDREEDAEPSQDYETAFELTGNFDNLGYWDVSRDMLGKTASVVTKKIREVLQNLRKQGYRIGVPDDDNPGWMWGHQKGSGYFGDGSRDLPRREKIEILMWWLSAVLDIVEKYDNNYYLISYP